MRTKSALVSALLALLSILASASAYTYTYPSYQGGENLYGLENSSELNKIVQLQIFNLIYGARLKYTPGKFIEPDISFRLRDFLRTNWTARGYSNQIPIDYFLETNIYTANLDLVVQFGDGDLYRLNWATLDVTGILNASGSANSGVPTGYYNVTPVFEDLFSQNLSQNDFSIQNLKNILDPLNDQFYCVQESHSVNPDSQSYFIICYFLQLEGNPKQLLTFGSKNEVFNYFQSLYVNRLDQTQCPTNFTLTGHYSCQRTKILNSDRTTEVCANGPNVAIKSEFIDQNYLDICVDFVYFNNINIFLKQYSCRVSFLKCGLPTTEAPESQCPNTPIGLENCFTNQTFFYLCPKVCGRGTTFSFKSANITTSLDGAIFALNDFKSLLTPSPFSTSLVYRNLVESSFSDFTLNFFQQCTNLYLNIDQIASQDGKNFHYAFFTEPIIDFNIYLTSQRNSLYLIENIQIQDYLLRMSKIIDTRTFQCDSSKAYSLFSAEVAQQVIFYCNTFQNLVFDYKSELLECGVTTCVGFNYHWCAVSSLKSTSDYPSNFTSLLYKLTPPAVGNFGTSFISDIGCQHGHIFFQFLCTIESSIRFSTYPTDSLYVYNLKSILDENLLITNPKLKCSDTQLTNLYNLYPKCFKTDNYLITSPMDSLYASAFPYCGSLFNQCHPLASHQCIDFYSECNLDIKNKTVNLEQEKNLCGRTYLECSTWNHQFKATQVTNFLSEINILRKTFLKFCVNDLVWNDGLARQASNSAYNWYTYNDYNGVLLSNATVGGYVAANNGLLFKYPFSIGGQNLTQYLDQLKIDLSTFNLITKGCASSVTRCISTLLSQYATSLGCSVLKTGLVCIIKFQQGELVTSTTTIKNSIPNVSTCNCKNTTIYTQQTVSSTYSSCTRTDQRSITFASACAYYNSLNSTNFAYGNNQQELCTTSIPYLNGPSFWDFSDLCRYSSCSANEALVCPQTCNTQKSVWTQFFQEDL